MSKQDGLVLNMTDIYRKRLHSPMDKNGNIYYTTVEGAKGLSSDELRSLKENTWMLNRKEFCNSPTNIRRIWFSAKNCIVEYYAAPKKGPKGKSELVTIKGLDGIDFRNKAIDLLKLLSLPDYQRQQAIKSGTMQSVEITGSPFRAKGQYIFNNIEEIYFDWTALMSKDLELLYAPYIGGDARTRIINTYFNGGRLGNIPGSATIPLVLFSGNNDVKISGNYKRLKRIVMISHLQDIIDKYMTSSNISGHLETFSIHKAKDVSECWMDRPEIKQAIAATNSDVWRAEITSTTNSNLSMDNFILKPETYEFDRTVLADIGPKDHPKVKGKIHKYIDAIAEIKAAKAQEEQDKKNQEALEKAAEAEARDRELAESGPAQGSVYEFIESLKDGTNDKLIAKAVAVALTNGNTYDYGIALAGMPKAVQSIYTTEIGKLNGLLNKGGK